MPAEILRKATVAAPSLDIEVPCLGMVDDNSICALFRLERKFIRKMNANALTLKKLEQLHLVFKIRTGRIAETVARTLIALREEPLDVLCIFACNTKLLTNLLVP